jgi:hypothetical protein
MMSINEVPGRIPVFRPKCCHGFRGWLGLEFIKSGEINDESHACVGSIVVFPSGAFNEFELGAIPKRF